MPSPVVLEARATTRRAGRTFALACRLLPRTVRDDVYLTYLVFRTLDDLVDSDDQRAQPRLAAVEAWSEHRPARSPEADVLGELDTRYRIPHGALWDFCQGMRDDVARRTILTEEDLDLYCYRVAGTVGLVMASILGVTDEEQALPAAVALGQAMQRTNILRDIDEDRAHGRAYIAQETVDRFGRPLPGRREALLRDQIARANALYELAAPGIPLLRNGAYAVSCAARMYREILMQIERDGYGARPGRSVVSVPRKLILAAGARPRRAQAARRSRMGRAGAHASSSAAVSRSAS